MTGDRTSFKSNSGIMEKLSISLIKQAGSGNFREVYSILKSGLVDANVMDCNGNGALVEAAINCHHKVVNLLLDCGANVNQVWYWSVAINLIPLCYEKLCPHTKKYTSDLYTFLISADR